MSTEVLAGLYVPPSDAIYDPPFFQCPSASGIVISLVGMQFDRLATWATAGSLNRGNRVQNRDHHPGIMNIRRRECCRNGNAPSIDREMDFRPVSSAIRGIGANRLAPFLAGTLEPSTETRLRSMPPSLPSVFRSNFQTRSQTPFFCHSISRRRQVLPDPHPSSGGSAFHGIAKRSTTRIPTKARRSSRRGRPPRFDFRWRGSWGWMMSHNWSGRRFEVIPSSYYRFQQLTAS